MGPDRNESLIQNNEGSSSIKASEIFWGCRQERLKHLCFCNKDLFLLPLHKVRFNGFKYSS